MAIIEGYNMPDAFFYHEENTWVKVEGENVRVGITEFYQKLAGKIIYADLPFEKDELIQGEPCGKIQSGNLVSKLISPISGVVIKVNPNLEENYNLMNTNCYDKGWIMIVRTTKLQEELKTLYKGEKVSEWLKNKITEQGGSK